VTRAVLDYTERSLCSVVPHTKHTSSDKVDTACHWDHPQRQQKASASSAAVCVRRLAMKRLYHARSQTCKAANRTDYLVILYEVFKDLYTVQSDVTELN